MKRLLDPSSLRALARGCAVLGAGGGGDPYLGLLQALQATEDYGPVPLVDLDELPDDDLIMPCGGDRRAHGQHREDRERGRRRPAPRAPGGPHRPPGRRAHGRRDRRRATACSRSPGPPGSACRSLDADGMGRAFPEVPQVTMHLAGISPSPAVMTDERGNLIIFRTISGHWMERLERAAAVEFGGAAASTEYTLTAAQARGAHRAELGLAGDQDRRGASARAQGDPVAAAHRRARRLPADRRQGPRRRAPDHEAASSAAR